MSILGMSISKKLACSLIVLPEVPKSGRGGGLKAYPGMGDVDGAGEARTGDSEETSDIRDGRLGLVHQNNGAQPNLPTHPEAHTSPHALSCFPTSSQRPLPGQRMQQYVCLGQLAGQ